MFGVVVGALSMFAAPAAYAATAAQAQANCQLEANSLGYGANCVVWSQAKNQSGGDPNYYGYKVVWPDGSAAGGWYGFSGSPPPNNPCTSLTGYNGDFSYGPGQTLPTSVHQFVNNSNGQSVECTGSMSWSGTPTMDAYGHLHVHGTVTWDPNPGSGSGTAGTSAYLGSDGSAQSPQPSETNGASPQLCGGGSCYDPNSNNFCAVTGGGQVCLSGSAAASASGGCASGGGSTVCAGSPSAPSPIGAQGSTITDPATQIQGSDQYTQQNGSTGALSTVTVNTYSGAGSSISSGATSSSVPATKGGSTSTSSGGSKSPASSSTTGNGDSFNGGGDCNTPPMCTGDAVMCGVAQEQWRTLCSVQTQTKGMMGDPTQQPPTFASDSTKYKQSDVWQQASSSSGNTTGDQANQGTYDQSGFGYSTACPMIDLTVPVGDSSFVIPFSKGCIIGPWIYWTVIAFSLYKAVRITAGSAV